MEAYHVVWLLAAVAGLAAAGLAGNGFAVIAGKPPHLWVLAEWHPTTPLRAFALMVYAPLGLMNAGTDGLEDNPVFGLLLLSLGLFWGFMQGVFILTTFFGYT